MKTCLLLTDTFEPTADLLVAEMRRRGVPCVRWNLDRFPLGSSLTYRISNQDFRTEIESDGRRLDLDQVGSIWCRGVQALGFPSDLAAADLKFAEAESERVLTALYTVADVLWVNHPHCHIRANSKPAQLAVARRLGFDIPATVVTNDPNEVRAFVARSSVETIYKALTQSLDTEPGKSLFTSLMTKQALSEIDLIRITPGVFQKLVSKAYELRVTVIGAHVFAVRIDSQSRSASKIDWRRLPFEADAAVDLPSEIKSKISAFMKTFDLVYGAFDFIVTPDGRYVFLEVNPAGQYMWIESKLGLPITAALADALSDPCKNS